jgi:hypothetical protein
MKKNDKQVKPIKKKPIKGITKPRISSKLVKKAKKLEVSPKKVQVKKKPPVIVEPPPKPRIPGLKPIGRPPKYKTVAELQALIDEYFESCWEPKMDMFGNVIYKKDKRGRKTDDIVMVQRVPYTITGLAYSIDMTRETLLRYQENNKFSDTIKRAKAKCQMYAEESLFVGKNPTGAIFNLKNNYQDWKDKQEIDANHSGNLVINETVYR